MKQEYGPWISWYGGNNPVPGKFVQVQTFGQTRKSAEISDISLSDILFWETSNTDFDIICYRICKQKPSEILEKEMTVYVYSHFDSHKMRIKYKTKDREIDLSMPPVAEWI